MHYRVTLHRCWTYLTIASDTNASCAGWCPTSMGRVRFTAGSSISNSSIESCVKIHSYGSAI